MNTKAEIIADSINYFGNRLTTFVLTYPRIIHSEFMTHRVVSKNTASSRAIPVKKNIEKVENDPFIPDSWPKNKKGMQAESHLDEENADLAQVQWMQTLNHAVQASKTLADIGVHKQIANRLIEPFSYITVIATATDWENFFALRANKEAQPQFQELAYEMLKAYKYSLPKRKGRNEWHIPFGDQMPGPLSRWDKIKIATARCARISYENHDKEMDPDKDINLHDRLLKSGHVSCHEHCAKPHNLWMQFLLAAIGHKDSNFTGWKQYRKMLPNECAEDQRVKRINEDADEFAIS